MRKIFALGALLAVAASAQTRLAFEVASVKPAAPLNPQAIMAGKMKIGMNISGSRVDIGFLSLTNLICVAYEVKEFQVSGPDWMASQRFDIVAKMPEGATKEQVPQMLQGLLEERFHLKYHRGTKDNSVYSLVVGKGGAKMKEAAAPPPVDPAAPAPANPGVSFKQTGEGKGVVSANGPNGPVKMTIGEGGAMQMQANMTMKEFADTLTRFAGKPVIDATELKGKYEVALDIPAEAMRALVASAGIAIPGAAPAGGGNGGALPLDSSSDPSGGTVFSAVQKLGLKLEPQKKAVETIVVDSAEKAPVEN